MLERIRNATPKDTQAIYDVNAQLEYARRGYEGNGFFGMPRLSTERIERLAKSNAAFFVYEVGGEIVGFSSAFCDQLLAPRNEVQRRLTHEPKPFLFLERVGILPEHQGRGISDRMLHQTLLAAVLGSFPSVYAAAGVKPESRWNRVLPRKGFTPVTQVMSNELLFQVYHRKV